MMHPRFAFVVAALTLFASGPAAHAQKIYLNPSDQVHNPVAGGGNEAQYALINANIAQEILVGAGFTVRVDQDFYNAPANANSWGAAEFVSIHSNAGGGHGIETLHYPNSTNGIALAGDVQDALLANLPYQNRGLKPRSDLHVLNNTNMPACLLEAVFHDCTATSGYTGHPPSESAYLKSSTGQQAIGSAIANGVCDHFGKSCSAAPPSKGWIKGAVYRNPNIDDRIAGATVTVSGGGSQTYDGTTVWSFELAPGTYTVTATAPGFQSNSVTRTVLAGEIAWGSVGLDPTPVDPPDAGTPEPDAGTPEPDAGTPEPDAGTPEPDAGTPEPDAGAPEPDAGTPPEDAGGYPNPTRDVLEVQGGCGCAAGASGGAGLLTALPILFALGRRRRREGRRQPG